MTENMKKFLETVSKDADLCKKVSAMNKDELLAFAREQGFVLTDVDLTRPAQELDDDDLDTVAGGGVNCACGVVVAAPGTIMTITASAWWAAAVTTTMTVSAAPAALRAGDMTPDDCIRPGK